jgi:Mn-dependent DtxR family transcriptional regulator
MCVSYRLPPAQNVGDSSTGSDRELTELLAETTGVSPDELERRAEAMEFAPPEDAPVERVDE